MEIKDAFLAVMEGTVNMALATCADGKPNVRVVTYGWEAANSKTVYFTTFQGNQKVAEFQQNPSVALMPLPEGPDAPAQVRIHGQVRRSARSLEDIAPLLIAKMPAFAETVKAAGPMLEVYEVNFDQAAVTIGMSDAQLLPL